MSQNKSINSSAKLVKASARHLHIAPRKMRLVTNLVKNMYVTEAITQLSHTEKKGAPMLVKLLKSAAANAEHNFSIQPESLYIKSITTDMGTAMKRYFPRARGSAFIIRRKLSHVNVVLEEKKRKGAANSKFSLFKKKEKAETEQTAPAEAQASGIKPQNSEGKKPAAPKSSEQKKMNTVQQKRRLFNRKSGE